MIHYKIVQGLKMKDLHMISEIILTLFIIQCSARYTKTEEISDESSSGENEHPRKEFDPDNNVERYFESGCDMVKENKLIHRRKLEGHNSTKQIIVAADAPTTTTIKTEFGSYQGNRKSEESYEESKSKLIDYPFSVSIQRKGAHYVTGALVDKQWILTAAGEFYNVRESIKLFRARLGSVDCKRGGTLVGIKKIEIHPYYIYKRPNFDIALLQTASPIEYSDFIRPISISNIQGKLINAKFLTTYWPRIVLNGLVIPLSAKERTKQNSMRVSTQNLISTDSCLMIMRDAREVLNESSLCLKPVVTHHSVCMPDAGAPVIAEDGLWGITSGWTSPTCPYFNSAPTIFTRLSSTSVRSWLDTLLLST